MDSNEDLSQIPVLTDIILPGSASSALQEQWMARAQELIAQQWPNTIEHVLARATEQMKIDLHDAMQSLTREVLAQVIAEHGTPSSRKSL